ncbi:YtxH domain-containing protein [Panacibacter sp. DH6]|uniref:YtxH domain-containing protein n=1 Tax=Panacibacter microcysteis TaxID=2793269 RepID=A0A931GVF6_9BACT|nr:YtxH domain-containing protein [Panacibacter microcysteis]
MRRFTGGININRPEQQTKNTLKQQFNIHGLMSKNEKIIAGILIGAAAGVAAVLFFQTEKGKQLLADIKDMASDTMEDAIQRFGKVEQKFKEQLAINETEEDV